ncbi:MAG: DUF2975 domain-containing protein [Clostridia bacterium]|nr:DUF2975 domain-containing protein [Clostridia bacterium]
MEQKTLARWLKIILIGVGICGIIFYALIVPAFGRSLVADNPEMSNRFWPWLIFILLTAVPCYVALVFGWIIAVNIGKDRSFSSANALLLKRIAVLAAVDTAFFFIGNAVMVFLNMSHAGVLLASLLIVFAGIAVTVAAAALSHLVLKAARLQEESDYTI